MNGGALLLRDRGQVLPTTSTSSGRGVGGVRGSPCEVLRMFFGRCLCYKIIEFSY